MSDFTTGGINFGYESPITRIMGDIQTQIIQDGENQVFQAVQNCDVMVDREELIKALQYDRGQYEKGYKEGAIEELEKIKEEIQGLIDFEESCCGNTTLGYECLGVIKDKISELKGETE